MWRYPIGTVVRFIPTEDQPKALWGHVVAFRQTALGQPALCISWQEPIDGYDTVLPSEVEMQP